MNIKDKVMNIADKMSAVRYWQHDYSHTHPLTCGNDSNHKKLRAIVTDDEKDVILSCDDCDYTQEWIPEVVFKNYNKRQRYHGVIQDDGKTVKQVYNSIDKGMFNHEWTLWDYMTIPFYRLKHRFDSIRYAIKYWFQRRRKGYSEDEVWGMNSALQKYIYPRLKAFVEGERVGHPGHPEVDSPEKWDAVLKKMLRAFELSMLDDDAELRWDTGEELKGYYKEMEEGFTLFGKYMMNLWD